MSEQNNQHMSAQPLQEQHKLESVCIIGAGLGGLFTGAILAHEGLKVTLLEKNSTIGGGLQSFRRFGEVFDTGMHVFGGMQEGGNIRRLSEFLGVFDESMFSFVDENKSDSLYVASDNTYYNIRYGREGFVDSLSEYFPAQRENLKRYVGAMYSLTEELPLYYLRPAMSGLATHSDDFFLAADAFIAKFITDERLRSVLAFLTPLYSGRADTTPAYIHSIVSTLCINGPCRFVGGSDRFANKLRTKIESCGGKVFTSESVDAIHTEGRRITSLSTSKGNEYVADYYISDIHPATLLRLFDDKEVLPKAYRRRLDEIPNTYSAFTLNIKFRPGMFPYLDHTAYYMGSYADVWNYGNKDERWPQGFLYMTPPETVQGEFANKMIVTVPMAWNHVEAWQDSVYGNRPTDYNSWKQRCAEAVIQCLQKVYPDFLDCIDKIDTASPLTIRDFYGVKGGSMCGYVKDCKNITFSHIPVQTKIPNLLLTGQCVNLHGFCGVALTSIITSEAILGSNYVLNKINEQCPPLTTAHAMD